LVGAGALVGTGKLEFWPVIIATALGCIIGDQVSYWVGRIFGERLKSFWPLSAYPHLVAKGEDFIKKHGGKSIALGRFVPGVKAVVPGIAGMFGMSQISFLSINVASGVVWSFAHVLPGVLLGQALALAGELSGRLLLILLILLVVLAVAGWLLRVMAGSITPYRKALQGRIANWARKRGSRPMRRFAAAIAPENPKSVLFVMLIVLSLLALGAFADIATGLMVRDAVGNLDYSLNNLFSEIRNAPADELLIRITMLGDESVLLGLTGFIVLWLVSQRAWKAALATAATVLAAKLVLVLSGFVFTSHLPVMGDTIARVKDFRFPSGHAAMAGVVFGSLATLISRGFGRWSQALVVALCGSIVIAIAFSRLYLGVSWLSDVIAGVLVAFVLVTIFSVVIGALPTARFRPVGLLALSIIAFLGIGSIHIASSYDKIESRYIARNKMITYALADWVTLGSNKVAARRIDLAGVPEEVFVAQWLGSPEQLQQALYAANYVALPKWTWRNSFAYLNPHAALMDVLPRPALHEGLKAKITAVQLNPSNPQMRLTIRAYKSNALVSSAGVAPVYLLSLTHEVQKMHFSLFAVPSDQSASLEEENAFIAQFASLPNIEILGEKQVNGMPTVILKPKS
jgi:membrane protein DedA with SNARE-associated domain/membrane-associated phospholipid phosphatase